MSRSFSHSPEKSNKRTRWIFFVLFSALVVVHVQPVTSLQTTPPPTVFELEFPDFKLLPSSLPEITIPSSSVNQILLHVLKPAADNIDYGAIGTSINGQATAGISEIVTGNRGKTVKIDLKLRPGFELVTGRNTVEIWAQSRRGRRYYSSFIVKTANEHWNEDFTYEVQQPAGAKNEVPPQVILLEPQRAIQFPAALNRINLRISGIATVANSVSRVSVDGTNIQFKAGSEDSMRQLTRMANSERSVAFETTRTILRSAKQVIVEVEDKSGSITRLLIPVITKKPGVSAPPVGQKYALIIGISKYRNNSRGVQNLDYADKDARAIYEFLQQPAAGGFAPNNMLLLINEHATLAHIRDALTNFIAKAAINDLLLIFFAGHGAPDPLAPQNLYLITHDTSVEAMPQTALAMPELRRYVEQNIQSKRLVLLLDACHSAGVSTEVTRDLANNLTNLYLEKLLYQDEGRAIITSSDINERSRESQKWGNGHGVFTYYVLEGLKGEADTNRDRFVSVGELFRFVRHKVRSDTQFQQNPRMLTGDNEHLALSVARAR